MFLSKYLEVGGKSLIEINWLADIVGPRGYVSANVLASSSYVLSVSLLLSSELSLS